MTLGGMCDVEGRLYRSVEPLYCTCHQRLLSNAVAAKSRRRAFKSDGRELSAAGIILQINLTRNCTLQAIMLRRDKWVTPHAPPFASSMFCVALKDPVYDQHCVGGNESAFDLIAGILRE